MTLETNVLYWSICKAKDLNDIATDYIYDQTGACWGAHGVEFYVRTVCTSSCTQQCHVKAAVDCIPCPPLK